MGSQNLCNLSVSQCIQDQNSFATFGLSLRGPSWRRLQAGIHLTAQAACRLSASCSHGLIRLIAGQRFTKGGICKFMLDMLLLLLLCRRWLWWWFVVINVLNFFPCTFFLANAAPDFRTCSAQCQPDTEILQAKTGLEKAICDCRVWMPLSFPIGIRATD